MALPTTNISTVYYFISCGVPSDPGVNTVRNYSTNYFFNIANDYILWGEPVSYPQPVTNTGSVYYATKCIVPSDPALNLQSNAGTHFYYSSSFNCVTFCDGLSGGGGLPVGFGVILYNGPSVQYNGLLITYNAAG